MGVSQDPLLRLDGVGLQGRSEGPPELLRSFLFEGFQNPGAGSRGVTLIV